MYPKSETSPRFVLKSGRIGWTKGWILQESRHHSKYEILQARSRDVKPGILIIEHTCSKRCELQSTKYARRNQTRTRCWQVKHALLLAWYKHFDCVWFFCKFSLENSRLIVIQCVFVPEISSWIWSSIKTVCRITRRNCSLVWFDKCLINLVCVLHN